MNYPPVTFCIFAHFMQPYIERGVIPYLGNPDEKTVELFLSIQQKPDDEQPDERLNRILKEAQTGRKIVFCVDAFAKLATSAVQYCHTVGIPYGLVVKVNGSLHLWSELHKQAPFIFVLGIGPTDQLPKLFPGAATQYDRSNRLTAPVHAKDFILREVEELEMR